MNKIYKYGTTLWLIACCVLLTVLNYKLQSPILTAVIIITTVLMVLSIVSLLNKERLNKKNKRDKRVTPQEVETDPPKRKSNKEEPRSNSPRVRKTNTTKRTRNMEI